VISLVADVNIQGHVNRLVDRMRSDHWRDYWDYLELRYLTFADLGLDAADVDAAVWTRCQERQALLITNNRNDDGPDSLSATIRIRNTPQSWPVFTLGNADAILAGAEYADQVIDRLLRYLLELENVRGTGRLYLP
jgi:hypothetical protein